eukprot:scaffold20909_cov160-Skeletonema_menzelii.AAC.1
MDSDHVGDEPLLSGEDDLQPSWVTLANEGEKNDVNDSLWDRVTARKRNNSASRRSGSGGGELPKLVLIMRLGNILAAGLLIFASVGNLWKIFNVTKMVLSGYGACFGILLCCLELNLSFLRVRIASSFGFLYNPLLRLLFSVLLASIAWSFETVLGTIASGALSILALFNTYVICRYPQYRAALNELSDEDEKVMKREARKHAWRYAAAPLWEV